MRTKSNLNRKQVTTWLKEAIQPKRESIDSAFKRAFNDGGGDDLVTTMLKMTPSALHQAGMRNWKHDDACLVVKGPNGAENGAHFALIAKPNGTITVEERKKNWWGALEPRTVFHVDFSRSDAENIESIMKELGGYAGVLITKETIDDLAIRLHVALQMVAKEFARLDKMAIDEKMVKGEFFS